MSDMHKKRIEERASCQMTVSPVSREIDLALFDTQIHSIQCTNVYISSVRFKERAPCQMTMPAVSGER